MGTNYYAIWSRGSRRDEEAMDGHRCWVCESNYRLLAEGCEWEELHIGKFSVGNVVMLRAYPDEGLFRLEDWIGFLHRKRAVVFSENLETVSVARFDAMVREWGSRWPRPLNWTRLDRNDWRPDGMPWAFTLEEFS